MFDEATLELEIPPDMLRKNPNLVSDIAKQVADEMAKKASGLYDDDIEVSAEGGGVYEDNDGRGSNSYDDYKYMKLTEQGSRIRRELESVIRERLLAGLTIYPNELGVYIPRYMLEEDPDLINEISDKVVNELSEEWAAEIEEEKANIVSNSNIRADHDPRTVSTKELTQNKDVFEEITERADNVPEALYEAFSLLGNSGVYYVDITAGAGKVLGLQGGYTVVVNLDNEFAASYVHGGGYASLSPSDFLAVSGGVQTSFGKIPSGLDKASDYTKLFLQGNATVLSIGDNTAMGVDWDGNFCNNVWQEGTHVSVSTDGALVSVSASADWYWLLEEYDVPD